MLQFRPFLIAAVGATIALSSPALAQHDAHQHAKEPTRQAQPQTEVQDHTSAPDAAPGRSAPYTLATCPVSGKQLGTMGDPVVKEYDGREVRFCCEGCIEKFEGSKDSYWKKIDEQMVNDQLPYYPLTTCAVSGEPLAESGEDIGINYIYRNRLVRFCCRDCVKDFLKHPEVVLKKLDAAAMQQQREHYPLQTCPVSGEKLGEMGEPYEVMVGSRLVRLCCKSCEKDLRANPLGFLPKLDEAWKAQGMPHPTDKVPEGENDAPGDHDSGGGEGHGEHGGG